jgi:CyaY protein
MASNLDEREYRFLCDRTMRAIDAAYEEIDPDLVESTISQGALTLLFAGGVRAIVSPQPPVRQMWLAYRDRAWHFDWDGARWIDDKDHATDLYRQLETITKTATGQDVTIR